MIQREPVLPVLSEAEVEADAYHRLHAGRPGHSGRRCGLCWCCCPACSRSNPAWRQAWAEKWADISEKVRALYDAPRPEFQPRDDDQRMGRMPRRGDGGEGGSG